jgi:hypothetical protein
MNQSIDQTYLTRLSEIWMLGAQLQEKKRHANICSPFLISNFSLLSEKESEPYELTMLRLCPSLCVPSLISLNFWSNLHLGLMVLGTVS